MKTMLLVAGAAVLVAVSVSLLWREGPTDHVAASTPAAQQEVTAAGEQPSEVPATTREAVVPPPSADPSAVEEPFDPAPVSVPPWLARFQVVDQDDRPVADAAITIWAARRAKPDPKWQKLLGTDGKANHYSGREPAPLLELRTDEQGGASTVLELECLYAAASKGRSRAGERSLWHNRSTGIDTRFVLEVPVLLRGLVVRADGSPGAEARVTARINGGSGLLRGPAAQPEPVLAGPDGRFELPVSRGGGYNFQAEWDGSKTFDEHRFIHEDPPPELVLAFPGGITLNGVVVDPDGKPVGKAAVRVWREYHLGDPNQDPDDYESAYKTTGDDGRFSIAVRKHARFQMLAAAEGHATSDLVWTEPTAVRPHAEVRLELQRFATIGGLVQHADGSPFAGVRVRALLKGARTAPAALPSQSDRFQHPAPASTGVDGRFELSVHPGTSWSIVAQPQADNPLLTLVTEDVAPGRRDVIIAISDAELSGCVVKGSVVLAADGQPVRQFEVGIVRYDEEGKPGGATRCQARVEDNRFELPPLPLGQMVAIQVTPGEPGRRPRRDGAHAPARVGPFVTGREGFDLVVRIDDWGRLPVQVLTADGTPARRTRVSAMRDVNLGSFPSAMPVDPEGRIVLQQCAPGAHKLRVWNEVEQVHEQDLTIVPGLNPEVVVRLEAGGVPGSGR